MHLSVNLVFIVLREASIASKNVLCLLGGTSLASTISGVSPPLPLPNFSSPLSGQPPLNFNFISGTPTGFMHPAPNAFTPSGSALSGTPPPTQATDSNVSLPAEGVGPVAAVSS